MTIKTLRAELEESGFELVQLYIDPRARGRRRYKFTVLSKDRLPSKHWLDEVTTLVRSHMPRAQVYLASPERFDVVYLWVREAGEPSPAIGTALITRLIGRVHTKGSK